MVVGGERAKECVGVKTTRTGTTVVTGGATLNVRFNSAEVGTMLMSSGGRPVTSNTRR